MAMKNFEIISKDKITPSSPTPQDHRIHELSFSDQLAPSHYISFVLFYQAKDNDDMNEVTKSSRLKDSLEQTLTRFYPLAGRIKEDHYVECNDEGVDYYEARVTCKLLEVLKHFNSEILSQFLPFSHYGKDSKAESPEVLLAIQFNNFDCGGVAIGVCLSHRIADGASATTFLCAWSAASRGAVLEAVYPKFNGATYFPPKDISWGWGNIAIAKDKIVTRRLVFDESSILALRDKAFSAAGFAVKLPTRVEAVSAFIWKRLMMISKSKQAMTRMCIATHAVNLRERTVPPMSEDSFGNLWYASAAILSPHELDHENDGILVNKLRSSIKAINGDYVKKLQSDEILDSHTKMEQLYLEGGAEFYNFTSLCRFPIYEADFGWGKPTWICRPGMPFKNLVVLMSTRDGRGIEAFVNILEEDAIIFDRDPEILPYIAWTIAE